MGLSQWEERAAGRRRIVVRLCLVALVGLSAVNVSGAAASTPEFVLCAKAQSAHSGKYSSNSCSDSSFVPTGGQRFEREAYPWAAAKKRSIRESFPNPVVRVAIMNPVGSGGGPSGNATVERAVECPRQGSSGQRTGRGFGQMTGPKSVTMSYKFKECALVESPPVRHCQTTSGNHIETDPLEGTLVYLNAEHTRVGLRVKGLGPGGRVMHFECPGAHLSVVVTGEYLTELTEDVDSASKRSMSVADVGQVSLQANMYEEEAFSETQGKEVLEWDYRLETCERGESPYPEGEKTEAECVLLVGPAPAAAPPITLVATVSGLSRERFPVTLSSAITRKGDLFLVETS